ncbi:putative cyclase/dehydrase [Saccharothrix espanaensis DSM] [Mycobacterium shimoidei]|uniref:Putative cyclase/dehydrase [Saccharothrix espanaensis DSM] n=1 Tax=Mycobacterium shimoidei TaxID=29313 RepID=A0A375YWE1_MYCSH|nr:SRPBCC family protein [Mycobacterium shimoidei]SRX93179.1 putative cyclase/dehydrase [Saccharothrix espanaensis DSM] [Mycobacterium shimoidei]
MTNPSFMNTKTALVKGLGGASLGLGLSEMLAPEKVAALTGVDANGRTRPVIRALGLRECGHAAALLFGPSKLVWTRVAGDALDLALLGIGATNQDRQRRRRTAVSAAALVGIAAADLYAPLRSTRNGGRHADGTPHRTVRAAVTVRKSAEEVYRFWRDLENLPSFMHHLKSVTVEADGRTRWVATAPAGQSVQWEAQITADEPGERIAWQSLPGSTIENGGSVEFKAAPGGRGTEVRVVISYRLPGGALGKAVGTLFGESADQQVNDDLRRFKQLLETGEVMRSDGSPEGTAASRQMHQHSAQPKGHNR